MITFNKNDYSARKIYIDYLYMYLYTHIHERNTRNAQAYISMCVCMCIYIHTHTHICIYIHIQVVRITRAHIHIRMIHTRVQPLQCAGTEKRILLLVCGFGGEIWFFFDFIHDRFHRGVSFFLLFLFYFRRSIEFRRSSTRKHIRFCRDRDLERRSSISFYYRKILARQHFLFYLQKLFVSPTIRMKD